MSERRPGGAEPSPEPGSGVGRRDDAGVEEDRAGDPPPRWGLGDAAAGYGLALLGWLVFTGAWVMLTGEDDLSVGLAVSGLVGQWAGMGWAIQRASRVKGSGSLATDFGLEIAQEDIGRGAIMGLACQFILIPILYLPFLLVDDDVDLSENARELTDLGTGWGLLPLVVSIVFIAPVVEEVFYRGLVQRALARRVRPAWAIAITAVVFGIAHFQPISMLGLAAFGAVLGTLAYRAGRLGPSIAAHAAFNAATVALLVSTR